jgi:hypothetical protein
VESATNKTSADPEYATPRNSLEKLANVPRPSYVTSKKPASHNEIINVKSKVIFCEIIKTKM